MSKNQPDKYVALGSRLKFLREQWQQSLIDVCNTLEIDEKMLRAYESGKILPPHDVLDMLISHFLLTEEQAQDLRDLADVHREKETKLPGSLEDILSKQLVMLMPLENKIIYTDAMQATVNENGVILQFMQQTGNGGSIPISRVGMSRLHAERVIQVLQNTLNHHDGNQKNQKMLPPSENSSNQ
jgi:transcriptional regulator with XRE-family HTH domain